jgi:hypothetical protein
MRQHFGGNAGASIADPQRGIVADRKHILVHRTNFMRREAQRLDRQRAAAVGALRQHRVARVDCQIDDDLLQLTRIGAYRSQVAAVIDLQLNRLAQQPLQQV